MSNSTHPCRSARFTAAARPRSRQLAAAAAIAVAAVSACSSPKRAPVQPGAAAAVASSSSTPQAITSPASPTATAAAVAEVSGQGGCTLLGPYFVSRPGTNAIALYDSSHNLLVDSSSLPIYGQIDQVDAYQAQDGAPVLLVSSEVTTPADGLTAASTAYTLSAYRTSGQQLWTTNATLDEKPGADGKPAQPFLPIAGAAGGVLVANNAYVAQITLLNGKVLWAKPSIASDDSEAASDGRLLFARINQSRSDANTVPYQGFNPLTGAPVGSVLLYPGNGLRLYPVGNTAVLQFAGANTIVSSFDGAVVWSPGQQWDLDGYDPTNGILVGTDQAGDLLGADATGRRLWSLPASVTNGVRLRISYANNGYASGTTGSQSIVLDDRTGKQVWAGNGNGLEFTNGLISAGRYLACSDNSWVIEPVGATPIAGVDVGADGSIDNGRVVP